MGEYSKAIHMNELMKYGDVLIESLRDENDTAGLKHFVKQSNALQFQCKKDLDEVQKSIQGYEMKIDACKKETKAAESDTTSDAELIKQLEVEQKLECVLREELRVIVNEIENLERERECIEQERRAIKKSEQNERRAQMELSMCASVTNIIPCLDDPLKISGHIADRENNVFRKFEFDPLTATSFATCDYIWNMLNL